MIRPIRALAIPILALTLLMGLAATHVQAQAPAVDPATGEAPPEGRPYDGYFATGAMAGGILFIVAKSARRS